MFIPDEYYNKVHFLPVDYKDEMWMVNDETGEIFEGTIGQLLDHLRFSGDAAYDSPWQCESVICKPKSPPRKSTHGKCDLTGILSTMVPVYVLYDHNMEAKKLSYSFITQPIVWCIFWMDNGEVM